MDIKNHETGFQELRFCGWEYKCEESIIVWKCINRITVLYEIRKQRIWKEQNRDLKIKILWFTFKNDKIEISETEILELWMLKNYSSKV